MSLDWSLITLITRWVCSPLGGRGGWRRKTTENNGLKYFSIFQSLITRPIRRRSGFLKNWCTKRKKTLEFWLPPPPRFFAFFSKTTLARKLPFVSLNFPKYSEQTGANCYLIRCLVAISDKSKPRNLASLSRVFGVKVIEIILTPNSTSLAWRVFN